jgi:broad specificity phosphatase PhoE
LRIGYHSSRTVRFYFISYEDSTLTHLILVRHSISQPQPGISAHQWTLTAEGQARCAALAAQLRPYQIARVATSDEPKAIATARLLADHLEVTAPLIIEPDFCETRRDTAPYFDSEGEFHAAVHAAMNRPDEVLFGEESFSSARRRITLALGRVMNAHHSETLAVVTHGTIMSLLLGHVSEKDPFEIWRSLGMPSFAVLTPNLDLLDLQSSIG